MMIGIKRIAGLLFIAPSWRLPMFALIGVTWGLGLTVAHISRATSYLSDQPEVCVNCHIMYPQYLTWQHSGHAHVTVCNDCHVPHSNLFQHYLFKAKDGLRHSTIFTLRLEPQVITTSKAAIPVIQDNCIRCHSQAVERMAFMLHGSIRCWDCHRDIPHGRERSLSATISEMAPQLPDINLMNRPQTIDGRVPRTEKRSGHE